MREGGWLFVELVKLGADGLQYFDVGGGLGVDYDGSQTNFVSSMNYSIQEYANDVVSGLMEVCDPAGVEHPTIVTESGRATVAHHAVLVMDVLGIGEFRVGELPKELPRNAGPTLASLLETYEELNHRNVREMYHDAQQYREDCLNLFNLGHLSLEHRVISRRHLLGDQPQGARPGARPALRAAGAPGHRDRARRHLLLQLLAFPVAARLLGDRPALPDRADPPARARSRAAAA